MIGLFRFKKKEEDIEKNTADQYSSIYRTSEQPSSDLNINTTPTTQNYQLQPERFSFNEPTLRYTQQQIPEMSKKPFEVQENYNYNYYQPEKQTTDYSYDWESYIQSVVEDILKDKFSFLNNQFSEIKIWKEKFEMEISKINEKIKDIENRINSMYEILAKKIEEYDKGIREATVEVEALHRLIRTMVPAISESTKELKETIEEIKQLRDQLKKA